LEITDDEMISDARRDVLLYLLYNFLIDNNEVEILTIKMLLNLKISQRLTM